MHEVDELYRRTDRMIVRLKRSGGTE